MTIKELIETLQKLPEDAIIHTSISNYPDSEDGLVDIDGDFSKINYNEKYNELYILSDFRLATTISDNIDDMHITKMKWKYHEN